MVSCFLLLGPYPEIGASEGCFGVGVYERALPLFHPGLGSLVVFPSGATGRRHRRLPLLPTNRGRSGLCVNGRRAILRIFDCDRFRHHLLLVWAAAKTIIIPGRLKGVVAGWRFGVLGHGDALRRGWYKREGGERREGRVHRHFPGFRCSGWPPVTQNMWVGGRPSRKGLNAVGELQNNKKHNIQEREIQKISCKGLRRRKSQ